MFFNKYRRSNNRLSEQSCLSESEISALQNKAKYSPIYFSETTKTSAENMAGDLQSRIRGAGVDFEENKPYQSSSDSRHINWRTYARTRQLYVNIYNEDKRPSTYIILDQREKMYFGTRQQLKIKQALKFAVYSIFRAMHQQQNVSGVQILEKPLWHMNYSGSSSLLSFIQAINTPLHHQQSTNNEPALNDVLNKLRLTDGTELIIISDFHDINDESITRLYNISRKFKVQLIQIQDPVEIQLPQKGIFDIQNNIDSNPVSMNCNDKILVSTYKKILQDKFSQYHIQLQNMNISFRPYLTTDKVFSD